MRLKANNEDIDTVMQDLKKVIDQVLRTDQAQSNPINTLLNCINAIDHLKKAEDPELTMSLKYLQGQISQSVIQLAFKRNRQRRLNKAVNQNDPIQH